MIPFFAGVLTGICTLLEFLARKNGKSFLRSSRPGERS